MTALADISQAIAKARCGERRARLISVGRSAAKAIMAETGDRRLPSHIENVPVRVTDAFAGFEVFVS